MKNLTKVLSVLLAAVMLLSLVACTTKPAETATKGQTETQTAEAGYTGYVSQLDADGNYVRADEEDIYEANLGEYAVLLAAAGAASDPNERFVLYAKAEAVLLDSAVMMPTSTRGGAYTISRVAPRTVPYVQWGTDSDRYKGLVISNEFLTPAERADLFKEWDAAMAGTGKYDPAAYLTSKGHTIQTTYTRTFQTAPVTLDWLNTSHQSDSEILVQTVDGLVVYDGLNKLNPALATSWDISEDGTVYTFHIREGVKWYTAEGKEYAELTAKDFVAGFRHMLDAKAGLEWLVDGIVVGATKYYSEGGSWDDVGYKATDDYTLQITLEGPTSYFMTMLTYSCFLPMCDSFYQSRGGVYGVEEYAAAVADTTKFTFGKEGDVASQVYCGAFLLQKDVSTSEILVVKNANYYDAANVTLDSVRWVYDKGDNPDALYKDTVDGVYSHIALTEADGLIAKAKADGNFDKYAYISETESTTFFAGLNLDRGTFALENGAATSTKTEQQKADTVTALNNKNFRKAIFAAFDKSTWNAVVRGEDLAETNLRNMYTHPEFVSLTADTTDADGHTFAAGTFYGDMVQYYLDQMGAGIKVADQTNGWFDASAAKAYLEAAVAELTGKVTFPIQIDIVYNSAVDTDTAQANSFKKLIEDTLGKDYVQVNTVETTNREDFYACGYRAYTGLAGNFDIFYGSGWGPDYGDPSTYLDTFAGEGAGYMTKVIGLF